LPLRRALPLAAALALAALTAAPAWAVVQPARPPRPALDVRAGERASVPAATRRARTELGERLGFQATVASDPVGGGVRSLGRTDGFLTGPAAGDAADLALRYVRDHAVAFGLDDGDLDALRLAARYRSNDGVTHLTWQQTSAGLPAYDSTLSANVTEDGRLVNVTGAPVHALDIARADPDLSAGKALAIAQDDVGGSQLAPAAHEQPGRQRLTTFANGDRASLVAFADPAGDRLAWRLTVAGEAPYVYDEVVDAKTGRVLARNSLTRFANARVFEYHPGASAATNPHVVVVDPGWFTVTTALSGPNVHAYPDANNDNAPDAEIPQSGGNWDFPQTGVAPAVGTCPTNFTAPCSWAGNTADRSSANVNRSQVTTQVFYFDNVFHDWLRDEPNIGFTSASHNFEGADPVLAESDDGAGFNNANMATPADGTSPRMQMFLFTSPNVNGGDDASVVYHEYTHGLSNRLVGNGSANGLNSAQSRAMGEAWSDWYALDYLVAHNQVTDTAADGEVRLGEYVTDNVVRGIRTEPIDCSVGPPAGACTSGGYTFGDMGKVTGFDVTHPSFEVHADGEIWAQTLWDLRKTVGAPAARALITGAMRLSPLNPSFLDMRNAILQEDTVLGGTRRNQIWSVFAARGMGYSATTTSANATRGVESFDTPALVSAAAPTVTDPGPLGDGDGVPEPGETVSATFRLTNPGATGLTNVRAALGSSTPGVAVGQPNAAYGSIPAGGSADPNAAFSVTLPASLACTTPIVLNLTVTADQGQVAIAKTVRMGSGASTVNSSTPVAIPDRQLGMSPVWVTSTLAIPSGGRAGHIAVTVSITHTFAGDLHAELISPQGAVVELFERPGSQSGSVDGFASLVLDDGASQSIQDVPDSPAAPVGGAWKPDEPLAKLADEDRAGTWTLRVSDEARFDSGTLDSWSVTTDQPACAANLPPAPTPTPTPTPSPSPTISGFPKTVKLDSRGRFTLAFRATPAGLRGKLAMRVPKKGKRKAFSLGTPSFRTTANGRVKITRKLTGKTLRQVRKLRSVKVTATITLGSKTFKKTFTLKSAKRR
jgi:subtilisin-like proprotein convertase family protein